MTVFNLVWKPIKFILYSLFLGFPALIIILLCYAYLNDIQYANGFWQYIEELLSSSQNPVEIIWKVIINFPFSDLLDNMGIAGAGGAFEIGKVVSNASLILENTSIDSGLFIGLVQLSLAQFIMFLVSRLNAVLQSIWKDKTFKFAYWYVSIFWTIVSFSISAVILKIMYLVINAEYLKIALIAVLVISYILHAILLTKRGFSIVLCFVYLALDLIFFFIQSVLLWYLGTKMIGMPTGDIGYLYCILLYFVFLILKEKITNKLLFLCVCKA